jgi:hypothetical protein
MLLCVQTRVGDSYVSRAVHIHRQGPALLLIQKAQGGTMCLAQHHIVGKHSVG